MGKIMGTSWENIPLVLDRLSLRALLFIHGALAHRVAVNNSINQWEKLNRKF